MRLIQSAFTRLSAKLLFVFLVLAIVPVAVVGYLAYDNARQTIERMTLSHLDSIGRLREAAFERWIRYNETILTKLGQNPSVGEYTLVLVSEDQGSAEYQAAHDALLRGHLAPALEAGSFLTLSIIRAQDGLILCSSDENLEGQYRESEPYFVEGKVGTYVGKVSYSPSEGAVMYISAPVHDVLGDGFAVLVASANLAEMNDIMLTATDVSGSEDTYLVNESRFFVTDPRFGENFALKKAIHTQGAEACLERGDGSGLYDDYRGVPVLGTYHWLPERELCILTEMDQAEVFAPIVGLRNATIAAGAAMALCAASLGVIFTRGITGPVLQLVKATHEIGAGNLDCRIDVSGKDEIGQLAGAFNEMTRKRKQAEQQVNMQRALLDARNRVLMESLLSETDSEVARTALAVAEELTGSQFGFIGRINQAGRLDTIAISDPGWEACRMPQSDAVKAINDMEVRGFWGAVITEARSQIVNDPSSHPQRVGTPHGHPELTSFLGVPLKHGDETIGLIALANKESSYDETDREMVENLAVALVEGLMHKRAEMDLRRHQEHLEELVEERTAELNRTNEDLEAEMAERKRADEALQKSEERFRGIFENAMIGLYRTTPDGRILMANAALVRMLGYSSFEELSQRNLEESGYEPGYPRSAFRQAIERDGQVLGLESAWKRRDGSTLFLRESARAARDEAGNTLYYEGSVEDITARKQMEDRLKRTMADLERSNKELEQFAYVASHDLQEPLRMVSSYTQLLARRYQDQLDQDAHEFIGYAVGGAERMQRLINDLLAYSRVGTRGKPFEATDCQRVLEETLANLRTATDEAGATITHDPLPTVIADESQLIQVFQNLVSNAIKFRGQLSPVIHIGAERQNNEWVFSVRDNGIGIDPQYYERIFVIFQTLHPRDQYHGTGIGLALCKRIVERHGGRIWVESEPGTGSTFYFTIPAKEASA
jgi:PAS domain S-box-containing protein